MDRLAFVGVRALINAYQLDGIDEKDNGIVVRSVQDFFPHPANAGGFSHDYALLVLDEAVEGVRPVALYNPSNDIDFERVTAIGLGSTDPMGNRTDRNLTLQEVEVPTVSNEFCAAVYGDALFDEDTMVCAGEPGKDTCRGDSGGPLLLPGNDQNDHQDVQVGVTSFGGPVCGGAPGVYATVNDDFRLWVANVVCGNSELMESDTTGLCARTTSNTNAPIAPRTITIPSPTTLQPTTPSPTTLQPSLHPTSLQPTYSPTTLQPSMHPTTLVTTSAPTPMASSGSSNNSPVVEQDDDFAFQDDTFALVHDAIWSEGTGTSGNDEEESFNTNDTTTGMDGSNHTTNTTANSIPKTPTITTRGFPESSPLDNNAAVLSSGSGPTRQQLGIGLSVLLTVCSVLFTLL